MTRWLVPIVSLMMLAGTAASAKLKVADVGLCSSVPAFDENKSEAAEG